MEKYIGFSLGASDLRLYLIGGFEPNSDVSPLHRHHYTEIHMVSSGKAVFWIENKKFTLNPGDVLLIPPKVYHYLAECGEGTLHSAFQVDCASRDVTCRHMTLETLKDFFDEIQRCEKEENYVKILSYALLVCSTLMDSLYLDVPRISDDALLISEFFSQHYQDDIHVSDLAERLHLSDRQTQLLVKRYTGKTFKNELTSYRMNIVDYLIKNTDMSMTDIAHRVGFQTYSGFWKAYRLYRKENENFK